MTPPQDQDYDDLERLAIFMGNLGATLSIALSGLADRFTHLGELISDAYHDRLEENGDEPAPGSTGGNTETDTPVKPPD